MIKHTAKLSLHIGAFLFFTINACFSQSFMQNLNNPDSVAGAVEAMSKAETELWKHYVDSGDIALRNLEYTLASRYYNQAAGEVSDHSTTTASYAFFELENRCTFLYNSKQYQMAEAFALSLGKIIESRFGKQHPDYINNLNNLATVHYILGEHDKVESVRLKIRELTEKMYGREHAEYAKSCDELARIYYTMGQFQKAVTIYTEGRNTREKVFGRQSGEYVRNSEELAGLYWAMRRYDSAAALYEESIQLQKKISDKDEVAYINSYEMLARLYEVTNQFEKAEAVYLEAKKLRENLAGKNETRGLENLAQLYMSMGDFKKAEPLFIEIRERSKKHLTSDTLYGGVAINAYSSENLGELYLRTGQITKATNMFSEAKKIFEKDSIKNDVIFAKICKKLALLHWSQHQFENIPALFKQGFDAETNLTNFTLEVTPEKYISGYIAESDKSNDIYFSFARSAPGLVSPEFLYDANLYYRNLVLFSVQKLRQRIFNNQDELTKNTYNDWERARRELYNLYTQPVTDSIAAGFLEFKVNSLEGSLTKRLPALDTGSSLNKVTWQAIQKKLRPGEAALEFRRFTYYNGIKYTDSVFYAALLLRKEDRQPAVIFLFTEAQLANLLSATGNKSVNDGVKQLYEPRGVEIDNTGAVSGSSVYELIWQPLEKELKGIKTIYFAPSGILHRMAFAALPVDKKEVLSDRYRLVQLASTSSITELAEDFITASDSLQLYGGINYDTGVDELKLPSLNPLDSIHAAKPTSTLWNRFGKGSFNYLPGTATETKIIRGLSNKAQSHALELSGNHATEEAFKKLDGNSSPAVIHLATHGFFFPYPKTYKRDSLQQMFGTDGKVFKQSDNPLFRSGLLFAGANLAWQGRTVKDREDGILTAYEVSDMYLAHTKLVVLSACETGLGDVQGSEGVYGLQRAFKIAGAKNLVMSLWKVPDAETVEFMEVFYKNIFSGQPVSGAFYATQATMKNKYRNDPYKWAAWVLVR